MVQVPSGTVSFLFSDVEGSTRLWQEHPQDKTAALARHDVILRGAIAERGGYVDPYGRGRRAPVTTSGRR